MLMLGPGGGEMVDVDDGVEVSTTGVIIRCESCI